MSDNTNNGFPVPEEPLTREEQYLSAIAGVTASSDIPEKPLTRVEAYLNKIVENGGGGGGGTTNYNALENKPQINGTTLSGNKSSADLGLQDTISFEGTYDSSNNKAATMADIKDGKLTGYAKTSGNVAATDKVIEAIGKIEKKADDNQSNISSVESMIGNGGLNLLDMTKAANVSVSTNMSYTTNADGTITVTATNANVGEAVYFENVQIPNGDFVFSGCPSGGSDNTYSVQIYSGTTRLTTDYGTGSDAFTISDRKVGVRIRVGAGTQVFTISPMIVYKPIWDSGFTTYQQYQPSNAELYALIKAMQ